MGKLFEHEKLIKRLESEVKGYSIDQIEDQEIHDLIDNWNEKKQAGAPKQELEMLSLDICDRIDDYIENDYEEEEVPVAIMKKEAKEKAVETQTVPNFEDILIHQGNEEVEDKKKRGGQPTCRGCCDTCRKSGGGNNNSGNSGKGGGAG